MTQTELTITLDRHKKWLQKRGGGAQADLAATNLSHINLAFNNLMCAYFVSADLVEADLRYTDLRETNFMYANLKGANLRGANLKYANLRNTNLCGADLREADLTGADLSNANLTDAYFLNANLTGANLQNADLTNADFWHANLAMANLFTDLQNAKDIPYIPMTCPETGEFIGWKKVGCFIIKLKIPAYAKRSSATGRKCRCECAKVMAIENFDGTPSDKTSVTNEGYSPHITYAVGEIVRPDSFDTNRFNECSHGIHFFINRQEAVNY